MIGKIRVISILMTSKPRKETIAIHILPNMSRNKGNQTMKFGLLIEYYTQNVLEKLFPTSF